LSTKIHLAVDGLGRPVRFIVTGGQISDITQASDLIAGFAPRKVIGDKGYDSRAFLDVVEAAGAEAVIPARSCSTRPRAFDPMLYRRRNLIERAINRLKQFRRIATRYDRNPANFRAFLYLAALSVWIT
jgi:transposase